MKKNFRYLIFNNHSPGGRGGGMELLLKLYTPWPNLKNLSGGLNLSRGLNMVGST